MHTRIDSEPENMLSDLHLTKLLTVSKTDSNVLEMRENVAVEYKESFTFDDQIMKTCAALANTHGGYIVFGVKDNDRKIVGLSDKHIKILRKFDLGDAHKSLNDVFVPSINIDLRGFELFGKTVGVIYVRECADKPVIATKNKGKRIKDRDIYYSYGGSIEKIRRKELDRIIDDRAQNGIDHFLKTVQIVAESGAQNIEMFHRLSGKGLTPSVQQFELDRDMLDSIHVLKEGEFTVGRGAPAIKLLGEVGTVREHHDINKDTVVTVFLDQEAVRYPTTFLNAICKHEVTYAPIYYFAHLAGFGLASLQNYISTVENPRKYTVSQLLKRLDRERDSAKPIIPAGFATSPAASVLDDMRREKDISIDAENFKMVAAALLSMDMQELDKDYIFSIARRLYQYISNMDIPYPTVARKLICYLDRVRYPLPK